MRPQRKAHRQGVWGGGGGGLGIDVTDLITNSGNGCVQHSSQCARVTESGEK